MTDVPTVAIVHTNPAAVEMLRELFRSAGFRVVACDTQDVREGRIDCGAFVREGSACVVVYDIAAPYERDVTKFEQVRALPVLQGCRFVLTSANPAQVKGLVRDEGVYEVVEREGDLLTLVRAVKEASRARPTK